MKQDILKIAGVKSEAAFYKKFPSEEAFMKAHGKEFKKAKMGAAMVKKQLTQLTDFSNPPQAQSGWHSEWDQDPYAQYSGADDSEAAYISEMDARNITESPMRTPSVNVPKSVTEAKKSVGNNYSVVDFLNANDKKSDFATRKALAESRGIKGYTGTAEQNLRLLSVLKGKTPAAQKAAPQKQSTTSAPQKKETPAQAKAAKAAEASKLSRAEQYIANDPYFFAEESDPNWIKAIDAPFSGLRNLGAKVVLDQDPMALLKLLGMGVMSNSIIGQTKMMPYNPAQIPGVVGASRVASKALPYATRALPGFEMGGYIPRAEVGDYIGGGQSAAYKPMNYTELYDNADYANTGSNRQMRMQDQNLAAQQQIAANSGKKGGLLDMLGQFAPQLDALSPDSANISGPSASQFAASDADINADFAAGLRYGGYIPRGQSGFMQGLTNFGKKATDFSNKTGKSIGQGYDKVDKSLGKVGGVTGAIPIVGDLVQGFQQLKEEKNIQKGARQAHELSGLTKQVAGLAPDIQQRKYTRPEDMAFGTQEMSQTYGAGTNYLARNGMQVGGNPTEIQNMYNPGDLYMDLGYEPLSDSEIVKQYRRGGLVPKAQFGDAGNALGSLIGGGKGRPTAGGKIGGTIGSTVGKFIPIPGASQALEFVGSTVGSIFGGKSAAETERLQNEAQQNTESAAFMSGAKGMQNQNAAFMEDGGWVSHDWQPQVIAKFGDYDLKDLLKDDPTMDTLRSGGHLKDYSYTPPSARAMSTERPDFAMGGQLKTTWGGYAEPISQNPYLPGSGETVMFRGKSHEESDGNGHTGIGVKYGSGGHDSYTDYAEFGTEQADADVEVERGEPATELMDRATGETSMIVYGDMKIPSYGVSELKDPKAKGKKFKNYANDLSKIEKRQSSILDKAINKLDNLNPTTSFEKLEFESLSKTIEGANMQLKGLAAQKELLAGIQNAILDTSKEFGVKSAELAKGKIKQDPDSEMAKFGGKFTQAQPGIKQPLTPILPMSTYYRIDPKTDFKLQTSPEVQKQIQEKPVEKKTVAKGKSTAKPGRTKLEPIVSIDTPRKLRKSTDVEMVPKITAKVPDYARDMKAPKSEEQAKKDKFGVDDVLRQLQPYLIPSDQEPFDYGQITPEMMALATNQLESVQAQTFQPLLETPYSVSFQDQLNANQADFNALQRQIGYNPAAASALAAQKYAANSAILGQQFRANQEMQMGTFNRNRGILNDATLKNLSILDQQQQRQSQARSATKAQAQAALSSIADKIAKHKLENRTLGVYENMYNYRFGPKGRAINVNAPYEFNKQLASMSADDLQSAADKKRESEKKSNTKEKTGKNGSICNITI